MSIQKTPTGYLVRWREDGRQRGRRFARKGDAVTWDAEVKRRQQLGPLAVAQLTTKGPTLAEWIADRWAPEHGSGLEPTTLTRYADAYRLHIAPDLGSKPLQELTVSVLRQWQAGRLAAGVSAGTIDKCRTLLSSVLRHAAESEAIVANPIGLVRPPKADHRDSVKPLAPLTIERIRVRLGAPMPATIPERQRGGGLVSAYELPDRRGGVDLLRDAAIVSILAYAGLRPGELRGLRWSDVREATVTVERAADDDGRLKSTKTASRRAVRLLEPLADDLAELRNRLQPPEHTLVLDGAGTDGAWTKTEWQVWRAKRWGKACQRAGLAKAPRPYDLRHSFASLLLAEGRSVHYVARQLGHAATLTLNTYGHLFDEYAEAERIDAEAEIAAARAQVGSQTPVLK